MKKTLKIFFIFIFTLLVFSASKRVEANYIEKISMDIYIDNNGNASITEIWNCYTDSGTEVYHPYYNLGNSEISNLTVSEDDTDYQSLTTWDTSKSLEEKAYKCGINTISNGVELCWGISSYSAHTYIVKYNISNFIANLNDSQMLYWTFIPYDFSNTIGDAYIKIYTDFSIPDNIDVWGYGNYGGTAYVYDGYIEMESNGRLDKNEYMTILVKFPNNTFNVTSNNYNNNFEDYYNMAEQGATQYSKKTSGVEIIISLIGFILSIAPFIVFIIIAIATQKNLKIDELKFGTEGKKIPKDVPYFRDIPCNNDIFKANYISYSYGISKNKTDILGAIILKWLKDNIVKVKKVDANGVFKKENIKNVTTIVDKTAAGPPTLASAAFPTKRPTMIVSTVVYNCWINVPSMIGKKNINNCFQITPSVIAFFSIVFSPIFCSSLAFSTFFVFSGVFFPFINL